jgi:hypothetical protein
MDEPSAPDTNLQLYESRRGKANRRVEMADVSARDRFSTSTRSAA